MRYCIAKDGKKWGVYDDYRKQFVSAFERYSKQEARERAAVKNAEYELAVLNGFVPSKPKNVN